MLDASAVIAWLKEEVGGERVEAVLKRGDAIISSVNLAEVLARFSDFGAEPEGVARDLEIEGLNIEPFGSQDAALSAALRARTRSAGLSLGDRACLALAQRLGAPALTADRAWSALNVGVQVELLR